MPDFTIVYRLDAIEAPNERAAAEIAARIMREVMNGVHPGANTFEVYEGDEYAPHGTATVDVDMSAVGPVPLAKPHTLDELRAQADDAGKITAVVALSLGDLLAADADDLTERVSKMITGDLGALTDAQIQITGTRNGIALLTVSGDVSGYLADRTCSTPECDEEYDDEAGDGYAGRCPGCADILTELEDAGEDVDYDDDTRTRSELDAARDALNV